MLSAARQRQSARPLEMDGRLRGEDRRQRARHRAQRQSVQRHDVPDRRGVRQSRSTASTPRQRAKWERLYEATQIKGDGETHPFLSPNDEFANFERWDKGNLDLSVAKKPEMLEFEYARSALKNGLKLEAEARRQSLQVRPGRQRPTRTPVSPPSRRTTSSARPRRSEPSPERADAPLRQQRQDRRDDHGLGGRPPPATPPSGRRRTPARRSSTPCSARRPTPPPARA